MGAYSSSPVTECESIDSENCHIRFGASSMQGWRRTQEDASNCCPDFDPENESMLFAVYDGHGGSEVAEYCSQYLPDFLKQLKQYKENKMEEALVAAFVEFDRTLMTDDAINKLKELAKRAESPVPSNMLKLARGQAVLNENDENDENDDDIDSAAVDCDEDETAALLEDACTPVEQVLARLTNGAITVAKDESQDKVIVTTEQGDGSGSSTCSAKSLPIKEFSNEAGGSGLSTNKVHLSASNLDNSDSDDDSSEFDEEGCPDDDESEGDESDDDDEELEQMKASQELALKFTESEDFVELPGSDSGCTACLALLCGNNLYIANAGDSRCVLSRSGKAIDLSVDHKPEDVAEKERIDKAGGFVTPDGRVNGNLNLSRAIGDHNYKRNKSLELSDQMITALPDIHKETLTADDEFIVLACDGIWNSLTSQQCVDFVKERLEKGEKISQICEDLFHSILAPDTIEGDGTGCDNMTCIIIDLQKSLRPDPKNHRTSSTGFDHTLSEDLLTSSSSADSEPKAKKIRPNDQSGSKVSGKD